MSLGHGQSRRRSCGFGGSACAQAAGARREEGKRGRIKKKKESEGRIVNYDKIRDEINTFVDERDWEQFHSPKNLAMAAVVEMAEIAEFFQ